MNADLNKSDLRFMDYALKNIAGIPTPMNIEPATTILDLSTEIQRIVGRWLEKFYIEGKRRRRIKMVTPYWWWAGISELGLICHHPIHMQTLVWPKGWDKSMWPRHPSPTCWSECSACGMVTVKDKSLPNLSG